MAADKESKSVGERLRTFAVRMVEMDDAIPSGNPRYVIGKQLMRAGTAPGAAYREAQHARSDGEFVSKIHIALQELEESRYWLEVAAACELAPRPRLRQLHAESKELTAILVTIAKNAN